MLKNVLAPVLRTLITTVIAGRNTPISPGGNGYVTEDGASNYVTEDGANNYVPES